MAIDSLTSFVPVNSATPKNTEKNSSNSLDMDDFFSLMVAQLSNQDMYNTMDNSQFMAQMAQFSMVQALADLNKMSSTAYTVGLIGKEVTVAETKQDGSLSSVTGIVESVNLYNGDAKVVVEGRSYDLSNIMIVKEPNIIIPETGIQLEEESVVVEEKVETEPIEAKETPVDTEVI